MEEDPKIIALSNTATAQELRPLLATMHTKIYFTKQVLDILFLKRSKFKYNKTATAVTNFLASFARDSEIPLQTKEVTDLIVKLIPKTDAVTNMAVMINKINHSAPALYANQEAADALLFLLQKATAESVPVLCAAISNTIKHAPAAKSFFVTPATAAALSTAIPLVSAENTSSCLELLNILFEDPAFASKEFFSALTKLHATSTSNTDKQAFQSVLTQFFSAVLDATRLIPLVNEAENFDSMLFLLDKLLEGNCHFATPQLLESIKTLEQRCESEHSKKNYKAIVDRLEFEILMQLLGSASTDEEVHVAVDKVIKEGHFIQRVRDLVLRKQALVKSEVAQSSVGKYLQLFAEHKDTNARPLDVIQSLRCRIHIDDSVTPIELLSLTSAVAPASDAGQLLSHALAEKKNQERGLRVEVAKFHLDLAWAASTFPQVTEFSELNSQLLIVNNFNSASINDLQRSIDHAKALLPVVLGANIHSLIDNASFNGYVKVQNLQGINNSLASCRSAIRAAELEMNTAELKMKMFEERKLTSNEHFFAMLQITQLEFVQRVEIDAVAVKLDFFNQSCIAALASHHDLSRLQIIHQEEEQHFMLNHDCAFDNLVIDENFASRILLSSALDSSFSSSVQEETSAHRVIIQEFELAQQRVQIQIDERIARELSIRDEERTIRQIVEDVHRVGRDILTIEEIGAFDEFFLSFTMISNELDKFNWFRLASHSLNLEFPPEFSKEKIIQMLETELLYKKEFLDVTDQTLKACGFPGAIINRLRKVIDHLSSASSFSSPAVQSLLDEVKSQLPGVLVLPPAEIGLKKHRDSKLGAGGYGDVYKATIISQRNRRCAAKIFYDKNIAIQEARNLFHLHHPNVVQLIAVTVEDVPNPSVVLLFELADCDLKHFIKSGLPLRKVRRFIKQIARGLDYLHQSDRVNEKSCIVHLDIKPENILVFRIGSSITLKISDLGFVHEMETSSTGHRTSFAATERYLSPETRIDRRKCRKNSNHDVRIFPAIDIFSFGIILLQMIAPKWYKRHGREQMQTKMDDVIHNEALLQSNECCIDDFTSEVGDCDDLVQLVKDCLMINRKNRPQNGAALLQRLSSGAAAQDFDVVNDSSDDSSSSSDDVNDESASDENDDEGGDNSTSNPNRQKRLRNTRSDFKRDGFPDTNSNNMPQTGRSQGSLDSAHQTLDDE